MATAQDIIDVCELEWEANKADCSAFVRSVAAHFGVTLVGDANSIVDQMQLGNWSSGPDGDGAKAGDEASDGMLVIAGLKGAENVPPESHGHVAIVVSGPIKDGKYPSAYWGRLGGVGEKNKTLNWAWNAASRDKVHYAAQVIGGELSVLSAAHE